jgi:hypothetical protein
VSKHQGQDTHGLRSGKLRAKPPHQRPGRLVGKRIEGPGLSIEVYNPRPRPTWTSRTPKGDKNTVFQLLRASVVMAKRKSANLSSRCVAVPRYGAGGGGGGFGGLGGGGFGGRAASFHTGKTLPPMPEARVLIRHVIAHFIDGFSDAVAGSADGSGGNRAQGQAPG